MLSWFRIVTRVMSAADDMGLDAANRICQIERRSYRSGAPTPAVARGDLGYKQQANRDKTKGGQTGKLPTQKDKKEI